MTTGTRWWIRFCTETGFDPLLFTQADLPLSFEQQTGVESRLVLFIMWMGRYRYKKKGYSELQELKGATLRSYASHVQMWTQTIVGGVPLRDVSLINGRLKALFRCFMRERPSELRLKVAFTALMYNELKKAVRSWSLSSSRTPQERFQGRRTKMMVAAAMEGLLRTSELAAGRCNSAANLHPFLLQDLHWCYLDDNEVEHECPWNDDGTIDTENATYLRVPMTAHKADQFGERGDELMFPTADTTGHEGTFEVTRDFVNAYPVDRRLHPTTPWFRQTEVVKVTAKALSMTNTDLYHTDINGTVYYAKYNGGLVSEGQFWECFKALCRSADIRFEKLGKHCFRVGGMNALQFANASVVEIMALGRWRSDAWRAYVRRTRRGMMKWTNMVLKQSTEN